MVGFRSRALIVDCILLVSLVSSGGAQTSVVLPAGFAGKTAVGVDNRLTQGNQNLPLRVQYGYDIADLPQSAVAVRSIGLRQANQPWSSWTARTQRMSVSLSTGRSGPGAFSRIFDANHGTDRRVAFSGDVVWPLTVPKPGIPPFLVRIKLASPFIFAKANGRSIVVDFVVTSSSARSGSWNYDLATEDWGKRSDFNIAPLLCLDSLGRRVVTVLWRREQHRLQPGGSFSLDYIGGGPGAAGIASIGFTGIGDVWGRIRLPIDLTALGAPGC